MPRAIEAEPTLRSRKKRPVIGHLITRYCCNKCWSEIDDLALPYAERDAEELREGDDAGVPFECHKCGEPLTADGSR